MGGEREEKNSSVMTQFFVLFCFVFVTQFKIAKKWKWKYRLQKFLKNTLFFVFQQLYQRPQERLKQVQVREQPQSRNVKDHFLLYNEQRLWERPAKLWTLTLLQKLCPPVQSDLYYWKLKLLTFSRTSLSSLHWFPFLSRQEQLSSLQRNHWYLHKTVGKNDEILCNLVNVLTSIQIILLSLFLIRIFYSAIDKEVNS